MQPGNRTSEIKVAVFLDVDGTLCSRPKAGKRELRPRAVEALEELSKAAHVILWSMSGTSACERVLQRFPELAPYISLVADKAEFPCESIELVYSIDDGDVSECTENGNRYIVTSYNGGPESGQLLEAARKIVDDIRRSSGG